MLLGWVALRWIALLLWRIALWRVSLLLWRIALLLWRITLLLWRIALLLWWVSWSCLRITLWLLRRRREARSTLGLVSVRRRSISLLGTLRVALWRGCHVALWLLLALLTVIGHNIGERCGCLWLARLVHHVHTQMDGSRAVRQAVDLILWLLILVVGKRNLQATHEVIVTDGVFVHDIDGEHA